MPSAAVESAFRSRLEQNWSGPVLASNGVTTPPEGAEDYVVVQYPVANVDKLLGVRRIEEGGARLVLNVKSGTQLAIGLARADALAALFRGAGGKPLKFSGVEAFEPSAPIVNDQNDDGNWFELAVIVPYRYQFDVA